MSRIAAVTLIRALIDNAYAVFNYIILLYYLIIISDISDII